MDTPLSLIDAAIASLTQAKALLGSAQPPQPSGGALITTPAELDAALASAVTGATVRLATTLRYPNLLTLAKSVTVTSDLMGSGRMDRATAAPSFEGGLRITGNDIVLSGIEVKHPSPLTDIVRISGARVTMDRCRVLGDPTLGGKRGISAGGSAMTIVRCYIDDCWQPAQDAQAIWAGDMPAPGLAITDCYLGGGAQSVMIGGADPVSESHIPRDIAIRGCTLSKNLQWLVDRRQIKCALELKDAIGVIVEHCVFEYAGTSQGQGAYLIVLTPRNQGGAAPFSTVADVVIQNCTGAHASGILNMLGTDNVNPSGPLINVTMRDCQFSDIDPLGVTKMAQPKGAGRLFLFGDGPKRVTLDGITVTGQNLSALGYFYGVPPTGLSISRMALPPSSYGWKAEGASGGMGRAALLRYAPDAVLDSTVV